MRKRTGVAARVAVLVLTMLIVPSVIAANANVFAAPGGRWAGRVPLPHCPTTCSRPHGTYLEPGSGYDELRRFAAESGPDQPGPNYSPGIVPVPLRASELDTDGDGIRDRYRFAHPFAAAFPVRRHCSAYVNEGIERGWDANGAASIVLLFERDPPSALDALTADAFLGSASACAVHPPGEFVRRGILPVFRLDRERASACPEGHVATALGSSGTGCAHEGGAIAERNLGAQCPALMNGSNPVNAVTGNKYQHETDYAGTVRGELRFERHYNSQSKQVRALGAGWTHGYDRRLVVACSGDGKLCSARAYRPDGRVVTFTGDPGNWRADPIIVEALDEPQPDVFVLTDAAGRREIYTESVASGDRTQTYRAWRVTRRSGRHETLFYDAAGRLERVAAPSGRELRFEYDAHDRLTAVVAPGGQRFSYAYDESHRLASVTYPDGDDDAAVPASRANNPVRRYAYEHAKHPTALTGIIDASGARYASWEYDESGRAISSEHAGGANRVAFDYQPGYTAVTDARGRTRSFEVGVEFGVGLITAVTGTNCDFCAGARSASVSHDRNGFRDLVTDYEGNLTDFDFNPAGLLERRIDAAGTADARTLEIAWDEALRRPLEIVRRDAAGAAVRRTTFTYVSGRLHRRTAHDLSPHQEPPRATTFRYFGDKPGDPVALTGLLRGVDGPRTDADDHTYYDYDPVNGNLLSVTNALGHVTRYSEHDAHGRPRRIEDANGVETTLAYHPRGWLTERSVAGARTAFDYDDSGQLRRVTLADGSYVEYAYDAAHRLERVTDAVGNRVHYELDALGNRIGESIFDPDGTLRRALRREYDADNRLVRHVSGEGDTTTYAYDANGDLVRTRGPFDADGADQSIVTEFERDALGRVVSLQNALGGSTRMSLDALDRHTRVTAPNGVVTRYDRNGFGEVRAEHSADAGTTFYAYDGAGNRTRKTDARGVTVSYVYDALNRLTAIDYPSQVDVTLSYDADDAGRNGIGRLTAISDESGPLQLDYDARGNVISKGRYSMPGWHAVQYSYDLADRLTGIRYPDLRSVVYERDAAGRVVNVRLRDLDGRTLTLVEAVRYAPFGPVESWRHGNGVAMTRSFDHDYRIAALDYTGVLGRDYRRDSSGNIEFIDVAADPTMSERYRYDALSRLTRAEGPWGVWNYTYDANGNRLEFAGTASTERYRYVPGSNRLDAIEQAGSVIADYATDAAGNVVVGSEGLDYAYGEDGRVARIVSTPSSPEWAFTHNGLGQTATVLERSMHLGVRQFSYGKFAYDESGRLLAGVRFASGGRGNPGYGVAYLDGIPIARWEAEAGRADAADLRHLHTDHLGTPIAETDTAGQVVARHTVPPFGGSSEQYGAWHREHGAAYPGQFYVEGSGHVFLNGHREYDARAGRYLQSDPIGLEGGLNTYAYALNNPVRFIDPTGLAVWICTRPTDKLSPGIGVANHAYLWDDRTGASCGQQGSRGRGSTGQNETGWPRDACNVVEGSSGLEDEIMTCCNNDANDFDWIPIANDCFNAADDCIRRSGLNNPGAPGGRIGQRCDTLGCRE